MYQNFAETKKSFTFAPHLEKCTFMTVKIWNEKCGNSSVGRAQPCQGWGREFESRFPLFEILAQVAEW